jgi:predicted Ser/Thr protein kinase
MKNKGRKMHLDFFDNTKEPRLFLSIDCLNQTFQIHNHELLKEFIKKQCINVKAKKFDELYDKKATSDQQLEKLTNDWLSALMKAGFSNKDAKQTSKKKVKI